MVDTEWLGERTATRRRHFAAQFLDDLDLPKSIEPAIGVFDSLGPKISGAAVLTIGQLREKYGVHLPHLMGVALRESWFACATCAWHVALMVESGEMLDNEYTRRLATAEGYAELEGWANTLIDSMFRAESDSEQSTFLSGTPFDECPEVGDILTCMGVYWWGLAADAQRRGDTTEAFDWCFEAQQAMDYAYGLMMWDEGAKTEREDTDRVDSAGRAARSSLARKGAMARHAENHALKADVFAWCDANMAQQKSIDAAASLVAGKVVPATWRTVQGWISEWKKIRSASTP